MGDPEEPASAEDRIRLMDETMIARRECLEYVDKAVARAVRDVGAERDRLTGELEHALSRENSNAGAWKDAHDHAVSLRAALQASLTAEDNAQKVKDIIAASADELRIQRDRYEEALKQVEAMYGPLSEHMAARIARAALHPTRTPTPERENEADE